VELGLSLIVLGVAVGLAVVYFRRTPQDHQRRVDALGGFRPWRRLGAAICLVLAAMFVCGVYLMDARTPSRVFAAYWLVMLVLVVWLCALAVKDVLHTRRMLLTWRGRAGAFDETPDESAPRAKDRET
jgi:amino acid permease